LIFVVTGLNGFFRFLRQPRFTAAAARELMMVMQSTPYAHVLFGLYIFAIEEWDSSLEAFAS
jgi:hypothetical protein